MCNMLKFKLVLFSIFVVISSLFAAEYPAANRGCLAANCHFGIEPIRDHDSEMAKQIYDLGKKTGDENGCIVCHGGNPDTEINKSKAHSAPPEKPEQIFFPYPGSMWIIDKTCGLCHKDHAYAGFRSIMQTEAGKIQGTLWGWGLSDYNHLYGNYDINDPDGPTPLFGTEIYKEYAINLTKNFPNIFPESLKKLPEATVENIKEHPQEAAFTYLRSECQRCHVGVKGRAARGDYRGMGCAACHIPYSNEGYYEGRDEHGIPKDEKGHLLVHSIQATREAKVSVGEKTYSGIPQETCSTCHNRGKRIGVSYQGLMEFPYGTPFDKNGNKQPKLHSKQYLFIKDDVHHRVESKEGNPKGGLLCQDCHTTIAVHGNGNISCTTLADVEVECSDCHGTVKQFPWELPIGYGDEFSEEYATGAPRGISPEPLTVTEKFGFVYPSKDGFLLSARGNPLGNVVKDGDQVLLHSASGSDFTVPVLKQIAKTNSWQNPKMAKPAMENITKHLDKMECYACHSDWAPQCNGCHIKVDYSQGLKSTDWVASGNKQFKDGNTAESNKNFDIIQQFGKATEGRTYLRWENPILGINGEGRVSPIIPGCQQITTVIDDEGKAVINNKIWRAPPNLENGGPEGQRGLDMSPAMPHTTTRQARTCASCHTSSKALGYGENDGIYMNNYPAETQVDIASATGEILSQHATTEFAAIPDLYFDLDKVVTRDNQQLQTVGHHWPLSSPLPEKMRDNMERVGICISCHNDVPNGTVATTLLHQIGDFTHLIPENDKAHQTILNRTLKLAANVEIFGPVLLFILFIVFIYFYRSKKKRQNSHQSTGG